MTLLLQGWVQGFNLGGGALRSPRKLLGYFVWKITILRKKNHIFSNVNGVGGERAPGAAPPLDPPLYCTVHVYVVFHFCDSMWSF